MTRLQSALLVATFGVTAGVSLFAQAASPREFDAVSIREVDALTSNGGMRLLPSGDISVPQMRLRNLIGIAHQVDLYRVVNAPEWTNATSYTITARANAKTTRPEVFEMMRTMLATRFTLATHRETRQLPGFVLVRSGNASAPGLKPSPVNCEDTGRDPHCASGQITSDSMISRGLPLANLVSLIAGILKAPVVDQTGLTGAFDVDLRWSADPTAADDSPLLSTALQEQLGLKLQRQSVPTEVLVIDHIERPTEN